MFSTQENEIERARQLLGGYGGGAPDRSEPQSKTEIVAAFGNSIVTAPLMRAVIAAGYQAEYLRLLLFRVSGYLAVGTIFSFIFTSLFPLVVAAVAVGVELFLLRRAAYARAENFERDYTALLLSLASGVRTGLDPLVALTRSSDLFGDDSEVGREVKILSERIERGELEERAIGMFGGTINHPDVRLFRAAFILSRREGSSLAECLQRLAKVTRQRQSFRRRIRSAVAMQKLSAMGIAVCSVIIAVIQLGSNPTAMLAAWNHPVGSKALIGGGTLLVMGVLWMMRITRAKI